MAFLDHHKSLERNATLLLGASLFVVLIGGAVEIVPLFYLQNTIEHVEGVRPYSPLELAGRNIYIREGCYTCHSQMIRPMRDEVERYGHYSLAAESMYDHPFQWGSKRTGPDLARVGGRYSDAACDRGDKPAGSAVHLAHHGRGAGNAMPTAPSNSASATPPPSHVTGRSSTTSQPKTR